MFGRSDPKPKEPMKLPKLAGTQLEQASDSPAMTSAPVESGLPDLPRPAEIHLHRLGSLPEERHERMTTATPAPQLKQHEGHVMIGEGVKIVGEIRDCRRIEIHGTVEGDMEADELIVHENGLLKGNVKTDRARVHGSIDGDISVTHLLDVKSKGSVAGKTTYGELSIETGGRIVGTLDDRSPQRDAPANADQMESASDKGFRNSATG